VVVDDGSRMPICPVADAFADRFPVSVCEQKRGGPASARNRGAAAARGAILAFTDDDCEPAADWIASILDGVRAHPGALLGGETWSEAADDYALASSALLEYLYEAFSSAPDGNLFFASNNIAVPRDAFLDCGGFDAGNAHCAGEDREFCFRWRKRGFPMVHVREMKVAHHHPLGFASFCEMHFRYGRGAVQYHRARARSGASRLRFESPRFYLGMPRYAFEKFHGARAWRISALLALSQASHLAGYLTECVAAAFRSDASAAPARGVHENRLR